MERTRTFFPVCYMMKRQLNYRFQKRDKRDYKFTREVFSTFPPAFDVRDKYDPPIPVFDQGELGSCTANASALAYILHLKKQKLQAFEPSRCYIYANSRLLEGTDVSEDSGADLRDVMKAIKAYHVCEEAVWPYVTDNYFKRPPKGAYDAAKKHAAFQYLAVHQDMSHIKQALYDGNGIIFGIQVYESFMTEEVAKSGIVPMPKVGTESNQGGHAICIVAWDDSKKSFLIQNSWSKAFGLDGCCWMPYEYILNPELASDFLVMEAVS